MTAQSTELLRRVSVVIVHYRTPDLLRNCLTSMGEEITAGLEVIVIDNASEELAPDFLADEFPAVRYVGNESNVGYSRGVNAGIEASEREFVLILNPDIVLRPGALETIVGAADRYPEAGILAPKLLNPDGTLQHSCRRFYDWKTFVYRRTPLGKLDPDSEVVKRHLMLDYDHEEARVVDWVLGGAMLVRRKAIVDVGAMDERFFMYFEDVDWCYRMHQRGWRVIYEPASEMYHHHRRESAKKPLGKSFMSHLMSVVRFYEKWSLLLYLLKTQRSEIGRGFRFVLDFVGLNLAFVCAFLIRKALGDVLEKPVFGVSSYRNFWIFGNVIAMGTFYVLGFYRATRGRQDWVDRLFMVARGTGIVTVIMMSTTFLLQVQSYSRTMVLLFLPLATLFILAGRQWIASLTRSVRGRRLDLPRVAIAGPGEAVERMRRELDGRREREFEPVYLPDYRPRSDASAGALDPDAVDRFVTFIRAERIGSVMIVSPSGERERLAQMVPRLARTGVRVQLVPEYASVLGPDSRMNEVAGRWVVALGSRSKWRARGITKRLLDVAGAATAILLGALPNLLFVTWRGLSGRRPIFRREERYLYSGTRVAYRMYNPRPRGNIFSVILFDHYPRLFAVLRGRLSIVGVYPYRKEELPAERSGVALDAPAGITGLWWFYRGRTMSPEGLRSMDIEYVQKWSTTYDLKTFLRALTALVKARGHVPDTPERPWPDSTTVTLRSMGDERL